MTENFEHFFYFISFIDNHIAQHKLSKYHAHHYCGCSAAPSGGGRRATDDAIPDPSELERVITRRGVTELIMIMP